MGEGARISEVIYTNFSIDSPNTYDYYSNPIALLLHTLLSDEDVELICAALKDVMKGR